MKKFAKFLKTLPMKIYILLAAIVLVLFFSNDFGLVDIQKTAIVLAAAVDKTENGFSVTAQIAVPKGTERSSCGTASIDIKGEGETVSDCIAQIYSKTGWVPKLIFCNLILIGEETAKQDVFGCLDFFLRNEYMSDTCLIATCEGTADEMLTYTSAIEDTSSQALERLFSDASEKSGKTMKNTLKEFSIGYHGVSKSGYMPFVRSIDQDCGSESGGGAGSESSGSGGGSQSGGSAKGQEQKKVFSAEETAIFSEGKMVALLDERQTFAFSLLEGNIFSGTFTADEDGKPVTLTVLEDEGNVSLDMKGAPKAELSVNMKVRLYNRGIPVPIEDVAKNGISPELRQSAAEIIENDLNALWKTCKDARCDLLHLTRSLYRSSLSKYEEWKDVLLDTVEVNVKLKLEAVK